MGAGAVAAPLLGTGEVWGIGAGAGGPGDDGAGVKFA